RQTVTTMAFWQESVGQILLANGFPLLDNAGQVSHARMEQTLMPLFEDFDQRRKTEQARLADVQDEAELIALENKIKNKHRKD
ncbi:MAG: hydroxyacid dehydrogenase, partial [Lamprobacter sp.]|nr:hydroxyacid dehydrogenase [Lamprobacter sp.]